MNASCQVASSVGVGERHGVLLPASIMPRRSSDPRSGVSASAPSRVARVTLVSPVRVV